jgi:hypothetical protein
MTRSTISISINTTLVLPSCSTVNSTIGTTDRPTRIKTLSRGSRVQASPKHQQTPSLYRFDLLAMVCRWHTHVVGCHLHTLQAKLYSSMFWVWVCAIYIPCRQSFTPVCFEFDEWAKLVASYSSLMKIESQVKER